MTVRPASPADVSALVRVINRAYVVEAPIFHGDRTNEAEVRTLLSRPNARFLVIDDGEAEPGSGILAGAVYVELRGERGYFGMLAVDPERQGRGHGRQLIAAAESHARAAGCELMELDVVDQRGYLVGFYSAFGYAETGTPTPYANPSATKVPVALIHMVRRL